MDEEEKQALAMLLGEALATRVMLLELTMRVAKLEGADEEWSDKFTASLQRWLDWHEAGSEQNSAEMHERARQRIDELGALLRLGLARE